MMKVYLDGQELTVDGPSLGSALATASTAAEAAGRIVVDAELDGHPLTAQQIERADSTSGDELRLTSAEPRSLVLTTFLDVADAMESVKADQTAAAELIQVGQNDEALLRLADALAVWDQAQQAVTNGCSLLGLPFNTPLPVPLPSGDAQSSTVLDQAQRLSQSLEEVKRSVEAGDWTGLADALMYDMESQAATWRSILIELASIVRSARDADRFPGGPDRPPSDPNL